MVAAEAHYNFSCYRRYTTKRKSGDRDAGTTDDDSVEYDMAEQAAYTELHIRDVVIPNKIIAPFVSLTERLENAMSHYGKVLSISAYIHTYIHT